MKSFFSLAIVVGLLLGCQKQQSDEERKAEIDREVQQRLAAEHQAAEKQQLDQREADLKEREQSLTEKERASERPQARPTAAVQRREISVNPPPSSGGGYGMFYSRLEPYGDWFETDNYGYVWRPREVEHSRNWHPYTNGRWAYTDVGWTWVSEEPFGWATYHYGRWTRLHDVGWVWVPGNEWAPAWVSWRKSDNYVGWAPLPPEAQFERRSGIRNWADNYYDIGPDQYCFVSTREFGQQRVGTAIIPSERNVTIVSETTNVTNITYSNTTIVNQGPNYDELRSRSQQPIERLRLQREVNVNFDSGNTRPVVRGEVLEIQAPVIGRAEPNERPRSASRVTAAVDFDWGATGDHEAAKRARAKMKSEATPPPDAPSKTFNKPAETTAGSVSMPTTSPITAATATHRENATTPVPPIAESPTAAPTNTPVVHRSIPPKLGSSPSAAPSVMPENKTGTQTGRNVAPTATPGEQASSPTPAASHEQSVAPTATPPGPFPHRPRANIQVPQGPPREKNLHGQPSEPGREDRSPGTQSPTSTPLSSPATAASAAPFDKREMMRQMRETKKDRKFEREHAKAGETPASPSPSGSAPATSPSATPPS